MTPLRLLRAVYRAVLAPIPAPVGKPARITFYGRTARQERRRSAS